MHLLLSPAPLYAPVIKCLLLDSTADTYYSNCELENIQFIGERVLRKKYKGFSFPFHSDVDHGNDSLLLQTQALFYL